MGVKGGGDNTDDWHVDGSDDEKYDPSKSGTGLWEPSAEDILSLFDKLEKEKFLELKWVCLLYNPQVPVTNYLCSPIPLYILKNSKGIQHSICTACQKMRKNKNRQYRNQNIL